MASAIFIGVLMDRVSYLVFRLSGRSPEEAERAVQQQYATDHPEIEEAHKRHRSFMRGKRPDQSVDSPAPHERKS
jgi:hypothetical protein